MQPCAGLLTLRNMTLPACRISGQHDLEVFLRLGQTPLADVLITHDQLDQADPLYPLDVAFSPSSGLVQLVETVPPERLFGPDYPYFSSVSPALRQHFQDSARAILQSRQLDQSSLIIEAASNDGVMLKPFAQAGVNVLGIDPAAGPAQAAQAAGIPTLCTFFTLDLADKLVSEGKRADVFLANNVLAHVPDLDGFVAGIRRVLKDTGGSGH